MRQTVTLQFGACFGGSVVDKMEAWPVRTACPSFLAMADSWRAPFLVGTSTRTRRQSLPGNVYLALPGARIPFPDHIGRPG